VAVGGAPSDGGSAIGLGDLDRAGQAAVLARSRGFVGAFGPEALVALLVGVPAVVFAAGADEDDVRLVRSFLAGPPYGRLQVVEGEGSPAEVAVEVGRLLAPPVEALAGV
jgi:hypothetical protein